jgi:arsenical pump membrane protein
LSTVAGATVLNAPALVSRRTGPMVLLRAAEPGFLVFVLGLGVIVAAASSHGLSTAVADVLPAGSSLPDLLLITAISAMLANVVNNIPATLILLPVVAGFGYGPVLAMLIGVNIGPNLTQVGSLATLLWRRVLRTEGVELSQAEFIRLGLLSVPPALLVTTSVLWFVLRV